MTLEQPLKTALNQYYPALAVAKIRKMDRGLSHFNFLLENPEGGKIFAKVFRDSNALEVGREAELIAYLGRAGILTPQIYKTASGADYGIVAQRPVILYEYLEGHHPKARRADLAAIGRLMASLHLLPVSSDMPFRDQNHERLQSQLKAIVGHMPSFERTLLLDAMQLCGPIANSRAPRGMVHSDIFLDNCIKVSDSRLYLLDFENAGFDCFLLDIGRAILGCCLKDGLIDINLVISLMDAYVQIRALTKTEWDEMYHWLIFSIVLSIVWRYIEFHFKRPHEGRQTLYCAFVPALEQVMALDEEGFITLIHHKKAQKS